MNVGLDWTNLRGQQMNRLFDNPGAVNYVESIQIDGDMVRDILERLATAESKIVRLTGQVKYMKDLMIDDGK